MSGFFGSNEATSKWGGYFKQAISNVENTFDSLLEQPPLPQQTATTKKDTETETYVDPISGMVTTVERLKKKPVKKDEPPSRSTSDLSSRLAAVMAEKVKPTEEKVESTGTIVQKTPAIVEKKQQEIAVVEKQPDENTAAVEKQPESPHLDEMSQTKAHNDSVIEEESALKAAPVEVDLPNVESPLVEPIQVELPKVELPVVEPLEADTGKSKIPDDDKDSILAQRETQLFQAMENIAQLHDQMYQQQEEFEKTISLLKSSHSQLESKIQHMENDALSPVVLQKSLKKAEVTVEELKKQIATKDENIQGLLQEGEKLSKVELKHSTTIKKLRAEKQETDKLVAELTKKLEKAISDLTEATEKGVKKTESEKKLQESVKLLSDLTEQQTKHINKLESEKVAHQKKLSEKEVALKKAVESIDKECIKARAEADKMNAVALEKANRTNDELQDELTTLKTTEIRLHTELRELQIALQTVEEQAGLREDKLRQEVNELQTRLQQIDHQMDDINTSVDDATAPLLRQIEELQTQHALAIRNRDQAEQSIILRMHTAEEERKKAIEKDEQLKKDIHDLTEKLEINELQLEDLQNTVNTLSAQVETDIIVQKELEERVQRLIQEKEEIIKKEMKDKEVLKNQYQRLMKERLNEERKQYELKLKAVTAVQEVEEHAPIIMNRVSTAASVSSRSSFDSNSTAPAIVSSILTERLQATIRQLENQISFYQTQLSSSTQSRDELSEEIVLMSQEIEELRKETKKRHQIDKEYKELNGRYQTLLELLGEKTEQVEELKADLQDVKEMYKSQIIELLQK